VPWKKKQAMRGIRKRHKGALPTAAAVWSGRDGAFGNRRSHHAQVRYNPRPRQLTPLKLVKLLLSVKLCTRPASKCAGTPTSMKFKRVPKCPAKYRHEQKSVI